MTVTRNVVRGFSEDGLSHNLAVTAESENNLDISIPDGSTDLLVAYVLDVSQCKLMYIEADGVLLIEPNSGSVPDDPMTTVADQPYTYVDGDYHTLRFGTDITALYITNSSGAAVNLKLRSLVDPTV